VVVEKVEELHNYLLKEWNFSQPARGVNHRQRMQIALMFVASGIIAELTNIVMHHFPPHFN
jgi:hypothetical protein